MKLLYTILFTPLVWARLNSKERTDLVRPDRDLQAQCAALMDRVGFKFPFVVDCSCKFGFLSLNWECKTDICPEQVVKDVGISWNSTTLPFDKCLAPTFKGTYDMRDDILQTTSCSGSSNVTFNASAIAKEAGVPNLAATLTTLDAPEICVTTKHKPNDFKSLTSCSVTLDNTTCPCEVCEGGKEVKLLCQDLLASKFPDIPTAALGITTQCVGLNTIDPALLNRTKFVASQIQSIP
jgi:hypothetical protein